MRFLDEPWGEIDVSRLKMAAAQYQAVLADLPRANAAVPFDAIVDRVTAGDAYGVDNHSRSLEIAEGWGLMANAGDLDLLVSDLGIAAAIDKPGLDVLNNSIGVARFSAQSAAETPFSSNHAGPWRMDVAQALATVQVPNRYEPGRTYVPDIEELRTHPNIEDFRKLLDQPELNARDAADAAAEISERANRFARQQVAKVYRNRPWWARPLRRWLWARPGMPSIQGSEPSPAEVSRSSSMYVVVRTVASEHGQRSSRLSMPEAVPARLSSGIGGIVGDRNLATALGASTKHRLLL